MRPSRIGSGILLVYVLSGCNTQTEVEHKLPQTILGIDQGKNNNASLFGITLRPIPAGQLLRSDEKGRQQSIAVRAFRMAATPVTNRQFEAIIPHARPSEDRLDDAPVTNVSLKQIDEFIAKISRRDRLNYRLPTSSEWEYAARGGLVGARYPWGDESPDGRAVINQLEAGSVRSHEPNRYGLYEMGSNVDEIVIRDDARSSSNKGSGRDADLSNRYVTRGSSYSTQEVDISDELPFVGAFPFIGFRLACDDTIDH